jgi:hypothetical protein
MRYRSDWQQGSSLDGSAPATTAALEAPQSGGTADTGVSDSFCAGLGNGILGRRASPGRLLLLCLAGGLLVLQQVGAPLLLQQACICAQLLLLLCARTL